MSTVDELEKVKLGYTKLDSYDKIQFKKFIGEFDKKPEEQRVNESKAFSENIRNKSLGPTSSAKCPCCNR